MKYHRNIQSCTASHGGGLAACHLIRWAAERVAEFRMGILTTSIILVRVFQLEKSSIHPDPDWSFAKHVYVCSLIRFISKLTFISWTFLVTSFGSIPTWSECTNFSESSIHWFMDCTSLSKSHILISK